MLERLADIERRYEELSDLINDPEIIADNERWRKLMKEHSDITPIVEKYREYKKIKEELAEAEEMLNDSSIDDDFKALVKEEFSENKKKIVDTEEELKMMTRMLLLKLEVVQVVTKQIFLLATFIECTLVMLKEDAGKLKLCL